MKCDGIFGALVKVYNYNDNRSFMLRCYMRCIIIFIASENRYFAILF